ncbi:MAG TPA: type I glyceraldehyde-3-phosphate dehydrogenase, partial [Nitrolancea sp.]|nr:type I glyceraldehyde-3-phosphate dehydrogenase [Nitrolancea sp.]
TVSLIDFVAELENETTVEELNNVFREVAEDELNGILAYTDEPLVSSDFRGDSHSSIVDGLSTMVMEGNLVKIIAWYDNEWGYSCRVADLANMMAELGIG